jgi:hypothetical protein
MVRDDLVPVSDTGRGPGGHVTEGEGGLKVLQTSYPR